MDTELVKRLLFQSPSRRGALFYRRNPYELPSLCGDVSVPFTSGRTLLHGWNALCFLISKVCFSPLHVGAHSSTLTKSGPAESRTCEPFFQHLSKTACATPLQPPWRLLKNPPKRPTINNLPPFPTPTCSGTPQNHSPEPIDSKALAGQIHPHAAPKNPKDAPTVDPLPPPATSQTPQCSSTSTPPPPTCQFHPHQSTGPGNSDTTASPNRPQPYVRSPPTWNRCHSSSAGMLPASSTKNRP